MHPAQSTITRLRSGLIVRAQLTAKRTIVSQMADDLRMLAASAGAVVADDMELIGWTPAQIAAHGREAARAAQAAALR